MPTYNETTTNANQAQQWNTETSTINNAEPLFLERYGAGKSVYYRRWGFRWQPNIDLSGFKIDVTDAEFYWTEYNTYTLVNFQAALEVYDGSAPNLSSTNITSGPFLNYTELLRMVFQSKTLTTGVKYAFSDYSPPGDQGKLSEALQQWFDRVGYAQTDWLGIAFLGDGTAYEKIDCYDGDSATAARRPTLEFTYTLSARPFITGVQTITGVQSIQF